MEQLVESLQTALEMERQGRRFYVDAADRARDQIVAAILTALADDEASHEEIILRYYNALAKTADWPLPDSTEGEPGARVTGIVESTVGAVKPDATFMSVYETARELEIKSRDFYQELSRKAEDRRLVEFMGFLARVEQAHLYAIETILRATRGGA